LARVSSSSIGFVLSAEHIIRTSWPSALELKRMKRSTTGALFIFALLAARWAPLCSAERAAVQVQLGGAASIIETELRDHVDEAGRLSGAAARTGATDAQGSGQLADLTAALLPLAGGGMEAAFAPLAASMGSVSASLGTLTGTVAPLAAAAQPMLVAATALLQFIPHVMVASLVVYAVFKCVKAVQGSKHSKVMGRGLQNVQDAIEKGMQAMTKELGDIKKLLGEQTDMMQFTPLNDAVEQIDLAWSSIDYCQGLKMSTPDGVCTLPPYCAPSGIVDAQTRKQIATAMLRLDKMLRGEFSGAVRVRTVDLTERVLRQAVQSRMNRESLADLAWSYWFQMMTLQVKGALVLAHTSDSELYRCGRVFTELAERLELQINHVEDVLQSVASEGFFLRWKPGGACVRASVDPSWYKRAWGGDWSELEATGDCVDNTNLALSLIPRSADGNLSANASFLLVSKRLGRSVASRAKRDRLFLGDWLGSVDDQASTSGTPYIMLRNSPLERKLKPGSQKVRALHAGSVVNVTMLQTIGSKKHKLLRGFVREPFEGWIDILDTTSGERSARMVKTDVAAKSRSSQLARALKEVWIPQRSTCDAFLAEFGCDNAGSTNESAMTMDRAFDDVLTGVASWSYSVGSARSDDDEDSVYIDIVPTGFGQGEFHMETAADRRCVYVDKGNRNIRLGQGTCEEEKLKQKLDNLIFDFVPANLLQTP